MYVYFSGYTELDLADRIHLLECCWMEILLLGLIWRSMDKTDVLYLASDLQLNKYVSFYLFLIPYPDSSLQSPCNRSENLSLSQKVNSLEKRENSNNLQKSRKEVFYASVCLFLRLPWHSKHWSYWFTFNIELLFLFF